VRRIRTSQVPGPLPMRSGQLIEPSTIEFTPSCRSESGRFKCPGSAVSTLPLRSPQRVQSFAGGLARFNVVSSDGK